MSSEQSPFSRFVEIVRALRHPETGCPWDLKQTHETLKPYMIEEAYEVLESIDASDDAELCGELGDLLLQVVLHAQLASERNAFAIDDVVIQVANKMVRRHPHVFEDTKVSGVDDVLKNWEQIKLKERQAAKEASEQDASSVSVIAGVPRSMPALVRAQRLGEKAAKVGFDWGSSTEVISKLNEEIDEIKEVLPGPQSADREKVAEELGDLLFAACQLARLLGISAEESLHAASKKFTNRFLAMEKSSVKPLSELEATELDVLWEKAKATVKS